MRIKKRLLSLGLSLVMIAGLVLTPVLAVSEEQNTPVDIPDTVLRTLINQTLAIQLDTERADNAVITQAEMALLVGEDAEEIDQTADEGVDTFAIKGLCSDELPNIAEMSTIDKGIRNLKGLEYAVNLKSLDLSENWIEDLTPLKNLKNITYLELDRNNISNLQSLNTISTLVHVNLYNNNITDISPLAGLNNVIWLDLHFANNGKAHLPIEALAKMPALEYISIESNNIVNEDLNSLTALENLNYIKLNANHITDLTPIKKYLDDYADGGTCRIEAINQTLKDATITTVEALPIGGDVNMTIPAIGGIDSLIENDMFDEAGVVLSDAEDTVTTNFFEGEEGIVDRTKAVLTFEERSFSSNLDKANNLQIAYGIMNYETWNYTFNYMLSLPVRLVQDAKYQTTLSANEQSGFVTIDTKNEENISDLITISIKTLDGQAVNLKEIKNITLHNGNNNTILEKLSAEDITVSNNKFSFKVKRTEDIANTWYVSPKVTLIREGESKEETIPSKAINFHLYIGDVKELKVDETIVFDLAKAENGVVKSRPFTMRLPGDKLSWATCRDKDLNSLSDDEKGVEDIYTFTIDVNKLEKVDHIYIMNSKTFLHLPIKARVIPAYTESDDDTVTTPEAPKTDASGSNTTVTIPVKPTTTGSISSATINDKGITDAVISAVSAAEKTGAVANVEIKVDAPKEAKTVEISISKQAVTSVANSKAENLIINSPVATIEFDKKAINAVSEGATGADIKISASIVDEKAITPEQKALIGNSPVYDFNIISGTEKISDFKGGNANVTLPYTLKDGEITEFVSVWHIDDADKLTSVGARYEEGKVIFGVGHFSHYAIGYLPFADIINGWYYSGVVYAYTNNIFNGVSDNTFEPSGNMTRAMLLTALHRMSGSATETAGETWYSNALAWAIKEGISDGAGPERNMSRQELATMLYRYAKSSGKDVSNIEGMAVQEFTDWQTAADWADTPLRWAHNAGIINGKGLDILDPTGITTRAEVAVMIARFGKLFPIK